MVHDYFIIVILAVMAKDGKQLSKYFQLWDFILVFKEKFSTNSFFGNRKVKKKIREYLQKYYYVYLFQTEMLMSCI